MLLEADLPSDPHALRAMLVATMAQLRSHDEELASLRATNEQKQAEIAVLQAVEAEAQAEIVRLSAVKAPVHYSDTDSR